MIRRSGLVGAAAALVAAGVVAGYLLHGSSGHAAAKGTELPRAINMAAARGVSCLPPSTPGPGHPQPGLSQVFKVSDNARNSYLLGWVIVPYHGTGTYALSTSGNIFAVQPPTGGTPLGFGSGTLTFTSSFATGTVHAMVTLRSGGTLSVTGSWTCSG